MKDEIWMSVRDYEGFYEISQSGVVRSVERLISTPRGYRKAPQRIITSRKNNSGYLEVRLSKDGICKTKFIHVLLASSFIPNPLNKKEVNHINGVKEDNRIENLEWVTHAENIQHAYQLKLIQKKAKPVIDTCTGKEYSSTKEAALEYNINHYTLKNYLSGHIKTNPTCLQYKQAA